MPVTLEMAAQRIMRLTIAVPWDVKDLIAVYPIEQEYFDAASENIFSIINLTNMGPIPAGALRARISPQITHPNTSQICIVGASAFAKAMAETVFKLTRYNRVAFFDTEEEAWAYLRPFLETENTPMQNGPLSNA